MKVTMYSIKDELNGFWPPVPLPDNENAKRYFREVQRTNSLVQTQPKDFSIWRLGEWDTNTAYITANAETVQLIERGIDKNEE